MKIIGLVPFKNEEWIFATCLASLRPVCDEVICIDDGSTDKSIKYPGTEAVINQKYSITLPDDHVNLQTMPVDWFVTYPRPNMRMKDWRWERMMQHFDQHGIEYFEKLQIWHYEPLFKEFVRRANRKPNE